MCVYSGDAPLLSCMGGCAPWDILREVNIDYWDLLPDTPRFDRLRMIHKRFPKDLLARNQFVVFGDSGYTTEKAPYTPSTGRLADVSDPDSWGTYLASHYRVLSSPQFGGIAFVLHSDDSLFGIDLDDAIVYPEEGIPYLKQWATDIVARFPKCYHELSVSRTGIHIIGLGKLPGGGKHFIPTNDKDGKIEIYDRGKSFCLTGEPLDETGTSELEDSNLAIVELYNGLLTTRTAPVCSSRVAFPAYSQCLGEAEDYIVEQCQKYLQNFDDAVSGSGGHSITFKAACVCAEFGLSERQMRSMMQWFNQAKTPADDRWSESELEHKINSAREHVSRAGSIGTKGKRVYKERLTTTRNIDEALMDPNDGPPKELVPQEIDFAEKPTVLFGPAEVPENTTSMAMKVLRQAKDVYSFGNQIIQINPEGRIVPVMDWLEFRVLLLNFCQFINPVHKYKEGKLPAPDLIRHLFTFARSGAGQLKELNGFSKAPIFDDDWNLLGPGYSEHAKSYYSGPRITPTSPFPTIDRILKDFCWKDPAADRTNFIAAMLDVGTLTNKFMGRRPFFVIEANGVSTGKSLLLEILGILRRGEKPQLLPFEYDEAVLTKSIHALLNSGEVFCGIDNAKSRVSGNRIDNAFLEAALTSAFVTFRPLHSPSTIRLPNVFTFGITVNHGSLSQDLITRSLPIRLYYEGPSSQRSLDRGELIDFVSQHRLAILGELAGMVVKWNEAGRPKVSVVPTRFAEWSEIVGSILAYNGFGGFLGNLATAAKEFSHDHEELADLADIMVQHHLGQKCSLDTILEIADEHLLFCQALGDKAKVSATSRKRRLSRLIGQALYAPERDTGYKFQIESVDGAEDFVVQKVLSRDRGTVTTCRFIWRPLSDFAGCSTNIGDTVEPNISGPGDPQSEFPFYEHVRQIGMQSNQETKPDPTTH